MVGLLQRNRSIIRNRHPSLLRGLPVDQHDACKNQRARALARRCQAALNEQYVEALFHSVRSLDDPRRNISEP